MKQILIYTLYLLLLIICPKIGAQSKNTNHKSLIGNISVLNKNWQHGGAFADKNPQLELLDRRTEFSKSIERADGKIDIIFGGPFHYADKNGAWQDIDLTIKKQSGSAFEFSNNNNRFISRFATECKLGVEIEHHNRTISFGQNCTITSDDWILSPNADQIPKTKENLIIYQNAFNSVDLEYEVTSEMIKHRLKFNDKKLLECHTSGQYIEISEVIQLPKNSTLVDLHGKVVTNRLIEGHLFVMLNDEAIFTIMPTRIWDNSFNENSADLYSNSLPDGVITGNSTVSFLKKNKIKYTIQLPISWLLSSDRKFPVTVDPTVYLGGSTTSTANYMYPFNTCRFQRRSQMLLLASEINSSGNISEIAFYQTSNNPISNKDVTIKIKPVTYNEITIPTLDNTLTTYYGPTDNSFTSGGAGTWRSFAISYPYIYSSTNNLLIESSFNNFNNSPQVTSSCQSSCPPTFSAGGSWGSFTLPAANRHRWAYSNSSTIPPDPNSNFCPSTEGNPGCCASSVPMVRITINPSCTGWATTPSSVNFISNGGNSSFVVSTTVGGCSYSATSNTSWINSVTAVSSTVSYHVDNNTGSARSGTISIKDANQVTQVTFTVNQDGVSGCSYSISPSTNLNVPAAGGSGFTIQVTTGSNCTWTSNAIEPWITINSGASGTGNGICTYSITSNNDPSSRPGSINSAGISFSVTQAGSPCTPPTNPPTPTVSNITCSSAKLTRANPPANVTYYWQGNSCGTSTVLGSGSPYTVNSSGTYYLRAYNNAVNCWSAGCSNVSVTLSTGPVVSISPVSPTFTAPDPLILTAIDIPGATYAWTGTVGNPLPTTSRI